MAACFSGVLNSNHWFKNQKIQKIGNDQDFVENGVMDPKIAIFVPRKKRGRKEREKGKGRKRD